MDKGLECCKHCEDKSGCADCNDLQEWITEQFAMNDDPWISVQYGLPEEFVSVLGHMDDAGGKNESCFN